MVLPGRGPLRLQPRGRLRRHVLPRSLPGHPHREPSHLPTGGNDRPVPRDQAVRTRQAPDEQPDRPQPRILPRRAHRHDGGFDAREPELEGPSPHPVRVLSGSGAPPPPGRGAEGEARRRRAREVHDRAFRVRLLVRHPPPLERRPRLPPQRHRAPGTPRRGRSGMQGRVPPEGRGDGDGHFGGRGDRRVLRAVEGDVRRGGVHARPRGGCRGGG
mmetsp:Transcript_39672/g.95427  ORF Transcript_39672/g.95427 Transcript_39672/m.95427 type:complete len:215 (+) Transcript_39672:761-1405(+)